MNISFSYFFYKNDVVVYCYEAGNEFEQAIIKRSEKTTKSNTHHLRGIGRLNKKKADTSFV
jgi:hypothetical protein